MAKIELQRGATTFKALPEDLFVVGVDTPHKKGEHDLWDERAQGPIDPALVESIRRFGVKQAVVVEPSDDGMHPYVKDGKRRTLHARAANVLRAQDGLPAIYLEVVSKAEDAKTSALTMRLLNRFRLEDDVLASAAYATDLLNQGCDIHDVAVVFGVTEQTVKIWVEKVHPLPEQLREAVRGGVAVSTALSVAKHPPQEWDELLAGTTPKSTPVDSDDPADPDELPQRKADKKAKKEKKEKPPSTAQVEGVRGKKWFKNLLRFKEHLPEEFVMGVEFVLQAVEDQKLPASIRKWVDGNRWDLGEINDPPSKTIANLISKTVKAENERE